MSVEHDISDRVNTGVFYLKSVEGGTGECGSYDKYVMFADANFVDGKAVIDLTNQVRPGTIFYYTILAPAQVHAGSEAEIDGTTIYQGQAIIEQELSTTVLAPINGKAVVMMIVNPIQKA